MQCFTTGDCSRRGGRGGQRSMTQQQGAPETLNDSTCIIYFHRGIFCERCDGICRWSPLVRRGDGENRGMIFSHGGRANHCVFMRRCREMHDDRKNIYGGPRLGIRLCVWRMGSIYSTISPTCCHCTESSAEDKLAFKWDKLFSLCPALNYQHHDFDYDKWRETGGFFFYCYWPRKCVNTPTHLLLFFISYRAASDFIFEPTDSGEMLWGTWEARPVWGSARHVFDQETERQHFTLCRV